MNSPLIAQTQPGNDGVIEINTETAISALSSPPILALLALVVFYVYLSLKGRGKTRNVIAKDELAGNRHIGRAREKALQQIERRKRNEVGLWVGTPEGYSFEKIGKKTYINVPDDPNTLFFPGCESGVLALGSNGSGKSFSFLMPLLQSFLRQGFPAGFFDLKYSTHTTEEPSPTAQIIGIAEGLNYKTSLFCPGLPESLCINVLDFIDGPEDVERAKQASTTLYKNLVPNSDQGNPYFHQASSSMIQGLMLLAKLTPYPDLLMCRCLGQSENLQAIVNHPSVPRCTAMVFDSIVAAMGAAETFGGIKSTVSNLLSGLLLPAIMPHICGKTNVPLDMDGRELLILGVNGQIRKVVLPIIAVVTSMIVNRNLLRPRKTPFGMWLDEGNAMFLDEIDEWPNQYRSAGLVLAYGTQSKEMVEKPQGKAGADRILKGLTTQAIFQLNDLSTCKEYSELAGKEDIVYDTFSSSKSAQGKSRSDNEHRQPRELVTPTEIAQFKRGKALVLSRGYADGDRVRVPLVHNFVLPQRDLDAVAQSVAWWDVQWQKLKLNSNFKAFGDDEFHVRDRAVSDSFTVEAKTDESRLILDALELATIEKSLRLEPLQPSNPIKV